VSGVLIRAVVSGLAIIRRPVNYFAREENECRVT
jgi:hypothetical protein